jgi:hypothetical protein
VRAEPERNQTLFCLPTPPPSPRGRLACACAYLFAPEVPLRLSGALPAGACMSVATRGLLPALLERGPPSARLARRNIAAWQNARAPLPSALSELLARARRGQVSVARCVAVTASARDRRRPWPRPASLASPLTPVGSGSAPSGSTTAGSATRACGREAPCQR